MSCWPRRTRPCASSTATSIDSRFGSQPTTARRGVPSALGATRAWISTSTGRVPSMPANTAAPGAEPSRPARKSADGLATSRQARAGHFEHADLVGRPEAVLHIAQDAEMMRAFALERGDGVDHVLDHARPGDLAVLGDVADQDHAGARTAWRSGSAPARAAHLRHRAGRRFDGFGPHGLDRVDHHQAAAPCRADSVAMMSSTEVSAASSTAASARPSRSARSRTWATASSPEI